MITLAPAPLPETRPSVTTSLSLNEARESTGALSVLTTSLGQSFGVKAGDPTLAPSGLSGTLSAPGLSGTALFRVAIDGVLVEERQLTDGGSFRWGRSGLARTGTRVVTVSWRGGGEPASLDGPGAVVLSVTADDYGTDIKDPGGSG